MKKLFLSIVLILSSSAFAKPSVVVSILPEQTFVQKIAKDMVDITVMVAPGSNPHSYEPKPSQMVAISKADIYFSIGVEFENVWLERFRSQNKKLRFVDISANITKMKMTEHHHEGAEEEHHHHGELDPHTWTSPNNVAIMAENIFHTLKEIDPNNSAKYKANLDQFLQEIQKTDMKIREILKNLKPDTKFMVFHPSWGYFAKDYGLEEVAIEVNGKHPKPKEIMMIVDEAKEEKVKLIFAQPEFSDKSAKVIAKEAGIDVEKISPLDADWSDNLIKMATLIAK
ncbi:zinc ABC transporter substrate-binding protein [bacterium]|nr:zinc ABC transporter substrate-binding protein [bacterium]MBU1883067.1 zinc ABC transporter substrate-binding protein [bacterium]